MPLTIVKKASRLYETVRWLKFSQTFGRVWYRVRKPAVELTAPPPLREAARPFIPCRRRPRTTAEYMVEIHGELIEIPPTGSWDSAHRHKLAIYHLHYFDDLNADNPKERRAWYHTQLRAWLTGHPPTVGIGWDAYPTSLRLVNWIKACLGPDTLGDSQLETEIQASAAIQARWLVQRLEYHLLGNHLWANAKALVFAGAFFTGEGESWLKLGLRILRKEIGEQLLNDGGHFERSPMYQATMTEDLLDLIALDRCYPKCIPAGDLESFRSHAAAMLRWLAAMTHPDGEIAQFNDAALGNAPTLHALSDYAKSLDVEIPKPGREQLLFLKESGYVRMTAGDATCIADVGPIGPDYIPGHAHADTLSFELSIAEARVFVNGGTSTYEQCAQREAERSTASHNTVVVEDQSSSDVWASFRVGRRARTFDVQAVERESCLVTRGAHDGYSRLPGKVIHHREFRMQAGELSIEDRLQGKPTSAWAHFHIHPDWNISGEAFGIELSNGRHRVQIRWKGAAGRVRIMEGVWARSFNDLQPCSIAKVPLKKSLVTEVTWSTIQ